MPKYASANCYNYNYPVILLTINLKVGVAWRHMDTNGFTNSNTTLSLASFQGIICDIDDIEKEIKQLEAKGIAVGNIDDTPWGKFAWLKDLDGNSLCLRQK